MNTLEQIKDALKAHIAEAEAATPGPWETDTANGVMAKATGAAVCYPFGDKETEVKDATFIAHARTMSPAACKCLLAAIDMLDDMPFHLADVMEQRIRQEWHNLTTK